MLREDSAGTPRLVAYVVGQDLDTGVLRDQLARELPAHMLPSGFVVLDALPVTVNGKLDRAALPSPDSTALRPAASGKAQPEDIVERHLLGIWESLFGRRDIGVDQDFFSIGGHSLLALRLVDAIERTFGSRLPLDTFWFCGNTIRDIAGVLRDRFCSTNWPLLVPIKPGGSRRPLFCVHTIGGNLFHYFELAGALSAEQPLLGLNARGVDGRAPPRSSIREIAEDCIGAMREAQPQGPYRLAGFSSGGTVAFEMARLLHSAGEHVEFLALLDTYAPGVRTLAPGSGRVGRALGAMRPYMNRDRLTHAFLSMFGRTPRGGFPDVASAHWWAHWGYRPAPYPGRIDLYIAEDSLRSASKPCLGWTGMAAGGLAVHAIPGSHGLMVKRPAVQVLAGLLQKHLDAIGNAGTRPDIT